MESENSRASRQFNEQPDFRHPIKLCGASGPLIQFSTFLCSSANVMEHVRIAAETARILIRDFMSIPSVLALPQGQGFVVDVDIVGLLPVGGGVLSILRFLTEAQRHGGFSEVAMDGPGDSISHHLPNFVLFHLRAFVPP